jgi:hypothetical protein
MGFLAGLASGAIGGALLAGLAMVVLRRQLDGLVDELLSYLDARAEPTDEPRGRRTL